MHWVLLTAAIVLEVAGTTNMKLSEGFTRPLPSVLIFVFYGLSFTAFTFALKRLDLSMSYAIWAGAGTALTTWYISASGGPTKGGRPATSW